MTARVLLTGSTGFLGRALARRLLDDGHTVAVVQRPQSSVADPRYTPIEWVGDTTRLVQAVADWRPGRIFHLATHFVSQHRTQDLSSLIDANIALGTALLEGAQRIESTVVLTGSAWQHVGGSDYHPVSLYAATKQALLDIAVFYADDGLDVRELTLFDTYGPGDTRRKLVPLLLEAAASSSPIAMSSGRQVIDLLYVSDVVDALLRAAVVPSSAVHGVQRYVARSGNPLTIRDLVHIVEQTVGRPIEIDWGKRLDRPKEMMSPWVFGSDLPDWTPTVDLTEGLARCWNAILEEGVK